MNNPITSQDWQNLYDSIKELRKSQEKNEKKMEKTDLQISKTDKQIEKTDKQIEKTDKQIAKTEKQIAKTEKEINKVFKMLGGHLNNVGEVTEEFFFRALKRKKKLGKIQFDVIRRNVGSAKEYDIIMVNGDSVAVISVKYKLHPKDINHFANKDLKDFKKYFPEFKNYKLYAGIASKGMSENLEKQITDFGLFAISQAGKNVKILNEDKLQAKIF